MSFCSYTLIGLLCYLHYLKIKELEKLNLKYEEQYIEFSKTVKQLKNIENKFDGVYHKFYPKIYQDESGDLQIQYIHDKEKCGCDSTVRFAEIDKWSYTKIMEANKIIIDEILDFINGQFINRIEDKKIKIDINTKLFDGGLEFDSVDCCELIIGIANLYHMDITLNDVQAMDKILDIILYIQNAILTGKTTHVAKKS